MTIRQIWNRRPIPAIVVLAWVFAGSAGAQDSPANDSGPGESAPDNTGMAFSFIQRTYTLAPGEGTGHRVLVVYAIPARRLDGGAQSRSVPARIRLSLVETPEDTVVLTDTVRQLLPMTTGDEAYALGLEELTLLPGSHSLRLYLGTADARIGLEAGLPPVVVDDLQHAPVWLSDLILGRQEAGLSWQRDGEMVAIDPLNTYHQGASIEVYYEVVGLPEGSPFETTISLTPVLAYNPMEQEAVDPVVSFGYDEVAESRFTALRRTFSLGEFPPGRYLLRVTAQTEGAEPVVRSTTIRVLAR